jgi:hypothetical protein
MGSGQEYFENSDGVAVRGYLHRASAASSDGLVLTHGAGANCDSLLLRSLAEALCDAGVTVLRCDLPFRQARPHGPPMRGSAERDREGLRAAVSAMRREVSGRVMLGGHSYGGRQASMLAAGTGRPGGSASRKNESELFRLKSAPGAAGLVDGLLLLSYPLHPPQRPDEMRTAHFAALQTPALFVHGTRDGFGSIAEMEAALKLIPARTELLTIEGAGHELMTKRNAEAVTNAIVKGFLRFCGG